jgi:RNA-directed DNA polymerase
MGIDRDGRRWTRLGRRRCWKADWVIDLDIQKFFDSVPWDLVVKAVAAHTDDPWVVL